MTTPREAYREHLRKVVMDRIREEWKMTHSYWKIKERFA